MREIMLRCRGGSKRMRDVGGETKNNEKQQHEREV